MMRLASAGLCPPVYGTFNNGLVYGFIPGRVLSPDDMADPHYARLIARKLARWHSLPITDKEAKSPTLFCTLRSWLEQGMCSALVCIALRKGQSGLSGACCSA